MRHLRRAPPPCTSCRFVFSASVQSNLERVHQCALTHIQRRRELLAQELLYPIWMETEALAPAMSRFHGVWSLDEPKHQEGDWVVALVPGGENREVM